ncbi:MAG: YafY family transcriptional regulator [Herpetosiphonaceae bacterium]|nr:YafY family transcriptional regulator [Herpetosiphonaceae bacterium]
MYFPTTRVLTLLELLQVHDRISGQELARRLEVSERSVRNYVAQLQDLGIPVSSDRGRYGGYRLRPGFKLPPLMFTADEAAALTLGLLASRTTGLTTATPAAEGALAKLVRVLPDATRQQIQSLHETLVIDSAPAYPSPVGGVVQVISQATQRRQRVSISYQAADGTPSERVFDPYGVVYHSGRWYTVGHCHLRGEVRMFRLDRVRGAELQENAFHSPAGFDILGYVNAQISSMSRRWSVEVLLHTSIAAARCTISPAMAHLEETAAGVVLRCSVDCLDWMAYILVGLGCDLEVLQPPELRTALRQLATRIATLIEPPPG